jgi:2'-deoxynucleoside 5'-phosphate N-hydrolase
MKIYFAGSIRGGRQDKELYQKIITLLEEHGTVLTEHVGHSNIIEEEAAQGMSDNDIFEQDMTWLKEADVVVAEVTTVSLGVGYEIGRAQALKKPILCLYRGEEGRLSAMIAGDAALTVMFYKGIEEIPNILKEFFGTL